MLLRITVAGPNGDIRDCSIERPGSLDPGDGGKMRIAATGLGASCVFVLIACDAFGQQRVDLDLRLVRPGYPSFDTNPVIEEPVGEVVEFSAEMLITTYGFNHSGVQGWSLSLWHGGLDVVSISDQGTVSADWSVGGLLNLGFKKYELAKPERSGGKQGVIQAVVFSFLAQIELPPNTANVVGRNVYKATVRPTGTGAFLRYEDFLRGSGQPVMNAITVGGESAFPVLADRRIAVGQGVVAEVDCADTLDNDQNGWADCEDPYCAGRDGCAGETCQAKRRLACFERCDDGVDNNGDSLIDCNDPDCVEISPCRVVELCDDGFDNNQNGKADCSDPECFGVGLCPGSEICGDTIDNDADGELDCEDSDCKRKLPCLGFEICGDNIDNNKDGFTDCADLQCYLGHFCDQGGELCANGFDDDGDGRTDCADPECNSNPSCGVPEVCNDGIDNDRDGKIDCKDSQCAGIPPCPEAEICGDGKDNDGDGKTDCDDSDCVGIRPCPGPELCSDDFDNDRDGLTDCLDPDCRGTGACPLAELCADGFDNDLDLRVDCDDVDCRRNPVCAGREICDDGVDNNLDGLVDCEDTDCGDAGLCAGGGGGGFDLVITAEGSRMRPARSVVDMDPEMNAKVPVTVYLVPFPEPQSEPVQGWALSITHDKDLLGFDPDGGAPTTAGTDVDALFSGGFKKTEVAKDPAPKSPNAGQGGADDESDGFISAVVLSFTDSVTLDPTRAQSLARARYLARESFSDPAVTIARVSFKDGLRGSGQPVRNLLTVGGATVEPKHLVPLEIRRAKLSAPFVRGDVNVDRKVNLADAIWCVNELLRHGPRSTCPRAEDVNDDFLFDLADPLYLILWMFISGPAIPPPYPACGVAAGPETLGCPEGAVGYCR